MSVQFVECADLLSYSVLAAKTHDGPIPVLACGDHERQARWRRVLAWYSSRLRMVDDVGGANATPGEIVAVDGEFEPVAKLLSTRTSLSLRSIAQHEILELLRDNPSPALTFVGSPSALNARIVRRIAANASVPWTIISGRDLAGASFAAAKTLALRDAYLMHGSWAILDAIADQTSQITPKGVLRPLGSLKAGHLDMAMDAGLVLHTHGEGAHADLKTVVLCGVSSSYERSAPGGVVIVDGCRRGENDHLCKRRAPRHARVVPFYEVTAARLILLTCNGYTPNGEMYPSDLCAPHSALEGTVAEIVTTLRPLGFPETMPIQFGTIAAKNGRLDDVSKLMTEWAQHQGLPGSVISIGGIAKPKPLQKGKKATPAKRLKPTRQAEQQLRHFMLLRERVERWEAALAGFALTTTNNRPLTSRLADLRAASRQLAVASRCIELALIHSHRACMPHSGTEVAMRLIALAAAEWDTAFARAIRTFDRDLDLLETLHGGLPGPTVYDTDSCERCKENIERRTLRLPLRPLDKAIATLCPNCGQRDLWWEGEGRLEIRLPATAAPDSTVEVRAARPPHPALWFGQRGWVLVQLQDKAGGGTLDRRLVSVSGAEFALQLRIPKGCPPDLHTLKVVWIQGLALATARRRIACVY